MRGVIWGITVPLQIGLRGSDRMEAVSRGGTPTNDDLDEPGAAATRLHQRAPAAAPSVEFVVRVESGVDAGAHAVVAPDSPTRVLVGTSPACALRLSDPEISRRHLGCEVIAGRMRLVDLDSSNGTQVAGLAIKDVWLSGGERVHIGGTVLAVEARAAVARAQTSPRPRAFGKLLGASDAIVRLHSVFARLAASNVPVVIEGETGTGKEVLAESLHEQGPRASAPFVVFDCTAVPANLMEAALFGHERGAFTGAADARVGVFEEAEGGTLFIDEIGDLALDLQAKLLRALDRRQVRRLGGKAWREVDVRIVAATRRNLDREIQEGRFRDDLFFRLAVGRVELPPLRARTGDVALLTRTFWTQLGGPGASPPHEFLESLDRHDWPGNVRELYNTVARRIALGEEAPVGVGLGGAARADDDVAAAVEHALGRDLPLPQARELVVAAFERRYLQRALDRHGGNVRRAAEASGIALRYFQVLRARAKRG